MKQLTDDQVEEEIARLTIDPDVRLARTHERMRYKRRSYLYKLRDLQKQGRKLRASGIDEDVLSGMEEA